VKRALWFLLLACPAGAETVRIGGIDWHTNYDAARKVAQREHKPLWLHFGENPG
jgi:hypothetical protein